MDKTQLIKLGARVELARRSFFDYCHLMAPEFYKVSRKYQVEMCEKFQQFTVGDDNSDVLLVDLPPRFGKSRTASLLVEWLLGRSPDWKIMTGSYNETLSTVLSKSVRNTIQEIKADEDIPIYSDVFPNTHVKQGDAAMNLWSLEDGYNNYLATSPSGTATGFGANLLIIDDLIKLAEEAFNENRLDQLWSWFTDTMLSRLESGGKIIVIMTRWATRDLAGRIMDELPDMGYKVKTMIETAQHPDGSMLCEDILSADEFKRRKNITSPEIFAANYQQQPIDVQGRLYKSFKTYDRIPVDSSGNSIAEYTGSYTDTADEGSDYLSSYIFDVINGEAYIRDVVFTQQPMEITEPLLTRKLFENKVNTATIESNNGGRGFAREVDRTLKNQYRTNQTVIQWFHNSQNKIARIISNSMWVMEHIYFPVDWQTRWPELADYLLRYQREGKNKHDDAPDALTGVCEMILNKIQYDDAPSVADQAAALRQLGF
ncbi:phage terminase large subunit [Loigolactobacillus backii]|uniref:phage terminase large subunit n=1 Tax=Loigolactobacillus backii TaxID=375175 RepID=UPI0007F1529D|nr:phage terminase large subunit [Loigolactobacillus backii]ANK59825.1 terminase [Loigolactobacillus backii]